MDRQYWLYTSLELTIQQRGVRPTMDNCNGRDMLYFSAVSDIVYSPLKCYLEENRFQCWLALLFAEVHRRPELLMIVLLVSLALPKCFGHL